MRIKHCCFPARYARHAGAGVALLVAALTSSCQSQSPPSAAASVAASVAVPSAASAAPSPAAKVERRPVANGPLLLRDGIELRKVAAVEGGPIALARNPVTGDAYVLHPTAGLMQVALDGPTTVTKIATAAEVGGGGVPAGMAFGPDGTLYVVSNRASGARTRAIIQRSAGPLGAQPTWQTLAKTAQYQLSGTPFDHLWNGIAVDPSGKYVYVNAGSRTDHGEVETNTSNFPDTRDVALTAKIFRLPADAVDLALPNDLAALQAQGLIFADGTRNAYDLEFAPNGDLFASDNGPDADYPDELNWIREGRHYGFPWMFGSDANPQATPGYDSSKDVFLNDAFTAVKTGTYKDDPKFPKAPGEFTAPVVNKGPDATQYRGTDGQAHIAAAEGKSLTTFTPHRSPLGLQFAGPEQLPAQWRTAADTLSLFVLSWGSAGGTLTDTGNDLLQLELRKAGDGYESVTSQIARDFKNPISAVLLENRLYVLEYGSGTLWELTFTGS